MVKSWCRAQKTPATSSGEAEFHAVVGGAAEASGLAAPARDLVWQMRSEDTISASGIVARQRLGKCLPLETKFFGVAGPQNTLSSLRQSVSDETLQCSLLYTLFVLVFLFTCRTAVVCARTLLSASQSLNHSISHTHTSLIVRPITGLLAQVVLQMSVVGVQGGPKQRQAFNDATEVRTASLCQIHTHGQVTSGEHRFDGSIVKGPPSPPRPWWDDYLR